MTNVDTIMKSLETFRLPELQAKYEELVGTKTRAPNKTFLKRKIREALEALEVEAEEQPSEEPATATVVAQLEAPEEQPATAAVEAQLEAPEEQPTPAAQPEAPAPAAQPEAPKAPKAKGRRLAPPRPQAARPRETPKENSDTAGGQKLKDLDVPALQTKYVEVVGRPTKSSDKNYLMWKIRQAQQGKVPVGPRESRRKVSDEEQKVLAMRFPKQVVDAIDEAWRRHGKKSRMEMIREAFAMYLRSFGEDATAELLA